MKLFTVQIGLASVIFAHVYAITCVACIKNINKISAPLDKSNLRAYILGGKSNVIRILHLLCIVLKHHTCSLIPFLFCSGVLSFSLVSYSVKTETVSIRLWLRHCLMNNGSGLLICACSYRCSCLIRNRSQDMKREGYLITLSPVLISPMPDLYNTRSGVRGGGTQGGSLN